MWEATEKEVESTTALLIISQAGLPNRQSFYFCHVTSSSRKKKKYPPICKNTYINKYLYIKVHIFKTTFFNVFFKSAKVVIIRKKYFLAFLIFVVWLCIVFSLIFERPLNIIFQCLGVLIWLRILHLYISQSPQIQHVTNKIYYLLITLLFLLILLWHIQI